MFNSIITNGYTINVFFICILTSLVCGLIIAFTHMKTVKYTKNFIISLIILPMLISIIITLVNGNLGTSVAIVGAFSLIRFRSLPGNSREILSVFMAMTIGLAIATGYVVFAIIITLIISLIILLISKSKFGDEKQGTKVLKILVPEDLDYQTIFEDIFNEDMKEVTLEKAKTTNLGSMYELTYKVILKNNN